MAMGIPKGKYISTVTVGEKGQIVIPKKIRDMFQIEPGDTLLVMADQKRGIAITRYDEVNDFIEQKLAAVREVETDEESH